MSSLFSNNNLANIAAIAAASGALYYIAYIKPSLLGISGGGGGGATGGGNGGGFWKRLLSPKADADENQSPEWDSHGLPADKVVQLKKLSGSKRYKVSAIELLDEVNSSVLGSEDSFFEIVPLQSGGVYTKAQLPKELETLADSGFFEKVDLKAKTNPDGTIGLTIQSTESTWGKANRFKCINVGLMEKPKFTDPKKCKTEKEKDEFLQNQEREYRVRMARARPCLLPSSVEGEIVEMLGKGEVSARMFQDIRDKVQKWYHDEGYACAQVVNFGFWDLYKNEVVCEVVEGDITRIRIQFEDLHGNVCEENPQIEMVERFLADHELQKGNVYNVEAWKQVLDNIFMLGLFSRCEMETRRDEKIEGGIIVGIKHEEL